MKIPYKSENITCQGYLALDQSITTRRPAILVAHAWRGQDDFARKKCDALRDLGYIGFALDYYGNGAGARTSEEAASLMKPLFLDRKLLQKRLQAGFDAIKDHPMVDADRIAIIGFCFGGLAAIELYRSGAKLRGAVSFHAVLGNTLGDEKAQTTAISSDITGSLLMLHGHDDPLVSQNDIIAIQKELTDAKVDWQMHVYGGTSHAFTVPEANDPSMGLKYNAESDFRSWQSMKNFFNELFSL